MEIASENLATVAIVLVAVGVLVWGYYRSRPYGKLGILSWLQSVSLMAPWLLFFGLFATGIYLNLAGILILIVLSAGLYIYLGRQVRAASQDPQLRAQLQRKFNRTDAAENHSESEPTSESESDNGNDTQNAQSPPSATPETETVKMPLDDLRSVQGIFGIDTFFATETIPYQDGAIFKGNLRGRDSEVVHDRLSRALEERLGDRYRLFLVENQEGKPVVVVLPSRNDPKPMTATQKGLSLVLLLATIATTLEAIGFVLGFDLFFNLDRLSEPLPYAAGIWVVLIAHELGHYAIARRYNVRLSWPFFLPTWQIGSFGAITRFESLLPNRKALFDIALAGPAAGGLVSLAMLVVGLLLSSPDSVFQIPAQFFKSSILVGTLAKVVLGSDLQQVAVGIHPLAILGWFGLVINAINLMPAGQLDGGRIVQSIYSRKIAGRATVATLILLGVASFANPLALFWAVVILVLQRDLERPSLNELVEPDDARAALGLLALFLAIAMLIPLTPSLAGRLGIGG